MKKVYVPLEESTLEVISEMARRERRTNREQVAVLIERGIKASTTTTTTTTTTTEPRKISHDGWSWLQIENGTPHQITVLYDDHIPALLEEAGGSIFISVVPKGAK